MICPPLCQVELLQQQVADLESQLANQRELTLQEVIASLNATDNKLGVQLTKVLEQSSQTSQSSSSLSDQIHAITQLHEASLSHESNTTINHELNSTMIDQLSGIPEGYQVITTTPEGHVIVSKARSSSLTSEDDISVTAEDSHLIEAAISNNNTLTENLISSNASQAQISSQKSTSDVTMISEQVDTTTDSHLATEDVTHCVQSSVLPEISISGGSSQLLQVVASEPPAVSIDISNTQIALSNSENVVSIETQDLTTSTSSESKDEGFVMDISDGSRIFIANSVQHESLPNPNTLMSSQPEEPSASDTLGEPDNKRVKITSSL